MLTRPLFCLPALLLVACSSLAAEMRTERDLPYTAPAHSLQSLDVYWSTTGKAQPILVWIHGGGWRRGDKRAIQRKPQALVERGFIFVSVNDSP